jgi:hypothetical protein
MFAASLDLLSRFGAHRAAIPHKNWLRAKSDWLLFRAPTSPCMWRAITPTDRKNGLTCRDFRKICRHLGSEH